MPLERLFYADVLIYAEKGSTKARNLDNFTAKSFVTKRTTGLYLFGLRLIASTTAMPIIVHPKTDSTWQHQEHMTLKMR
jgi:hypothetical protein